MEEFNSLRGPDLMDHYLVDPMNHLMLGKGDKMKVVRISDLLHDERVKLINKFRNFIRFKVIKGDSLIGEVRRESTLKVFTEEEKFLLEQYNHHLQSMINYRIRFLSTFYERCPEVGSTLKPKVKPKVVINDFI